jgi:peptide/nickel transport system substrate-binding protein
MLKRLLAILAPAALAVALSGCPGGKPDDTDRPATTNGAGGTAGAGSGAEPPSQPGKYGGTLTTAGITDPKTFNPIISQDANSSEIFGPLLESLNQRSAYTLKFEPRLAELPRISDDGLTYTYQLREGLVWSDGRPLTADDVLFTLNVIFDPKTEGSLREVMMVDSVDAQGNVKREPFKYRKVDDRTIEFTLPVRYAPADSIFSVFNVIPRHKLEAAWKAGKFNTSWGVDTPPSQLVSSGAWILTDFAPGQRLVYRRNPRFFLKSDDGKPLPYLDRYVRLVVSDFNALTLKFRNGDTDLLDPVQPADWSQIKKDESTGKYTAYNLGPGWGFNYLGFNLNPNSKINRNLIDLFQKVEFRRAVSHAVDRQRIADDVFFGLARPIYSPVSPANTLFFDPNVPKFEYDPEKAKTLLTGLGLRDGNGNGTLEWKGEEVRFNILTNTENNVRKQMGTILTDDLKQVGLDAQFTPVTFNSLLGRLNDSPFDWEAVVLGFTGGPEPHLGSNIWRSSGPLHQWWPKQKKPATEWEKEIDQLWIQGAQELNETKRKEIYDRWQVIAAEQLPLIYTVTGDQLQALRNRFGNIKPPPIGGLIWNLEEIYDTSATKDAP